MGVYPEPANLQTRRAIRGDTAKEWWVLDSDYYRGVLLGIWPDLAAYFDQPALPGFGG